MQFDKKKITKPQDTSVTSIEKLAISVISTIKFIQQTFWNIYSSWKEHDAWQKLRTSSQIAMLSITSAIPLCVYANAKFKSLLSVFCSFVYVNFQVTEQGSESERENKICIFV